MAKTPFYHSPHLDLNSRPLTSQTPKNASESKQRKYKTTSVNLEDILLKIRFKIDEKVRTWQSFVYSFGDYSMNRTTYSFQIPFNRQKLPP